MNETQATAAELDAGLDFIRRSPKDGGVLELIVRRPKVDEREILTEATLDLTHGLVGAAARQQADFRRRGGSGKSAQHHELTGDRAAGRRQGALGAGGGPAFC
jgi:hypothetical protein